MTSRYWAPVIIAGIALTICLIVLEANVIWTSAWVGSYLIVTAIAYRPPGWTMDHLLGDDEVERKRAG